MSARRSRGKGVPLLAEDAEAGRDGGRIVQTPGVLLDLVKRDIDSKRRSVGAVRRHRFDDIGDRKNAGLKKDSVSLQAARVAAAIQPLVVLEHSLRHRPRERDIGEDVV